MLCYSLADKSVCSIGQGTHALSQTAEGWVYVWGGGGAWELSRLSLNLAM